jgi:hypothetical protein
MAAKAVIMDHVILDQFPVNCFFDSRRYTEASCRRPDVSEHQRPRGSRRGSPQQTIIVHIFVRRSKGIFKLSALLSAKAGALDLRPPLTHA